MNATKLANGDIRFSWVRRTRIDGDNWEFPDVPLGEETELYQIRVIKDGEILRQPAVGSPQWVYGQQAQVADGNLDSFQFEVAQVSARYGPGAFKSIVIA